VTREINDGLLAPPFAPSPGGWLLSRNIMTGFPCQRGLRRRGLRRPL